MNGDDAFLEGLMTSTAICGSYEETFRLDPFPTGLGKGPSGVDDHSPGMLCDTCSVLAIALVS